MSNAKLIRGRSMDELVERNKRFWEEHPELEQREDLMTGRELLDKIWADKYRLNGRSQR